MEKSPAAGDASSWRRRIYRKLVSMTPPTKSVLLVDPPRDIVELSINSDVVSLVIPNSGTMRYCLMMWGDREVWTIDGKMPQGRDLREVIQEGIGRVLHDTL